MDTKSNRKKITSELNIPIDIPEDRRRWIIFRTWIREEKGNRSIAEIATEKGFGVSTFYNYHNGFSTISDKMKIALEKAFNKSM